MIFLLPRFVSSLEDFKFPPRNFGKIFTQFDVRIFFRWVGSTTNQQFYPPLFLQHFLDLFGGFSGGHPRVWNYGNQKKKERELLLIKACCFISCKSCNMNSCCFFLKLTFQFSPRPFHIFLFKQPNESRSCFFVVWTIKYLIISDIFIHIPRLLTTHVDSYSWLFRMYSGMKSYPIMWWL